MNHVKGTSSSAYAGMRAQLPQSRMEEICSDCQPLQMQCSASIFSISNGVRLFASDHNSIVAWTRLRAIQGGARKVAGGCLHYKVVEGDWRRISGAARRRRLLADGHRLNRNNHRRQLSNRRRRRVNGVGTSVGAAVGAIAGIMAVGAAVGAAVDGDAVGAAVVGCIVGDAVGDVLGAVVKPAAQVGAGVSGQEVGLASWRWAWTYCSASASFVVSSRKDVNIKFCPPDSAFSIRRDR